MIIEVKREFVGINDFRYNVSTNNQAMGTLLRQYGRDEKFHYTSVGLTENFDMYLEDNFVPLDAEGNLFRNVTGHFYTEGNGETIMFYCIEKGKNIFTNIPFWSCEYKRQRYDIYEVGKGKNGTYYCMWNDGITKAMIVRNPLVKHRQAKYDVYSLEDIPKELLLLWTMYFDLTKNYPENRYTKEVKVNTWQKELKNKYDPNFIPRIKEMYGISE